MTALDLLEYWLKSAEDALDTAETLYKNKKYNYSLFFCHLAIEKILKGLIFKKIGTHAPPIHDLGKLAKLAKLELSEDLKKDLSEITTWNIQARYDTVKFDFYKKATAKFTKDWLSKVKEIYLWLKSQY